MSSVLESVLAKIEKGIKENQNEMVLNAYEELLSENIVDLSKMEQFYKLPITNIVSVLQKVNYSAVEKLVPLLQSVIQGTNKTHPNESAILLHGIKCKDCSLSVSDCINIFQCFSNCDLCVKLGSLISGNSEVVIETNKADQTISEIKEQITQIENSKSPEKPADFEEDIYKAASQGKLSSVQYLIETMNVDKDSKTSNGDTPLHYACYTGQLPIVRYLIEEKGADKDSRNEIGCSPLHYGCQYGHVNVVQYLIEQQGVDKEEKDNGGDTPLIWAARSGNTEVVTYLLSIGVDKENTNRHGRKAKDFAWRFFEIRNLL